MAGLKIKTGDRVRVLSGKDKGKDGTVLKSFPKEGKVIVEGVATAKKHQKPTRMAQAGGIVEKDMPIDVSNVAILCPKDGPTRVGYRIEGETKTRICRKCGQEL